MRHINLTPEKEKLRAWRESHEALAAQVAPESLNTDERSINVIWFSGADVLRYDWRRDELYTLRFDPAGVDLSALNNGAPVLDSHSALSVVNQLGRVERAWVEGKNYLGTLRFSKREDEVLTGIWQDVADKIITKFSMGVEISDIVELDRKEGERPVRLAQRWRPYEISLVPIPADFGTTTLTASLTQPSEIKREPSLAARQREMDLVRRRN